MVLSGLLLRLAARAPVPVFPVVGAGGGRELVQDLGLEPSLRLVDSPREANVLLVAGRIPDMLREALLQVHDSLSHPRCTVIVAQSLPPVVTPGDPFLAARAGGAESALETILRTHGELLAGRRASDPPLLPDVDPAPWRGEGPYGQGGSGMTGGTPYGRPLAGLADDRDGLRLDTVTVSIGPFFRRFPPGLRLDVQLAGDVVLDAAVGPNPFAADDSRRGECPSRLRPFVRALTDPMAIAELEMARARSHLRWLSEALTAHGLHALGSRALRLGTRIGPVDAGAVRRLWRWVEWTQVLRWTAGSVGQVARQRLEGLGAGPVARAAGIPEDLRADDPAYRQLGFKPVMQERGDSAARWRQRLAEILQSLDLASRAGDRCSEPKEAVESPHGRLVPGRAAAASLLDLVPALVAGQEWGDAVTAIVSLDLDLEEAAVAEGLVMPASAG